MQLLPPKVRRAFEQHERKVERELKRDRRRLFRALAEFANMRLDAGGWAHFRNRWPNFFPEVDYDRVAANETPGIFDFPFWVGEIWRGGETDPYLGVMLGIRPTPKADDLNPEEASALRLRSIPPDLFALDWTTGTIVYHGGCDFQRALYLLFRESWRARICEACESKFIAQRVGQKYCSTDCSERMQREVKRKWWNKHGETWRKERGSSAPKKKGRKNGTQKAR